MTTAAIDPSTPTPPLETRVETRKRELISEIVEHKKNSSRPGAAEAIDRLEARLSELAHIVKEGVIDGWANTPALDGLRFHDQSRFRSSQVTRAFTSVIRAVSQAAQSEISGPDELTLGPDVAFPDAEIVRGAD